MISTACLKSQSLVRLSSLLRKYASLRDHPYVLPLVRHETEAWNNKFNPKYDTIRIQRMKLHHFPCISVCLICHFTLWFLRTPSSMSTFHPKPFSVLWRLRWHMLIWLTGLHSYGICGLVFLALVIFFLLRVCLSGSVLFCILWTAPWKFDLAMVVAALSTTGVGLWIFTKV